MPWSMKISGGTGLTWIFGVCATASRPPAATAATPAAAPVARNRRRVKVSRSSIVILLPSRIRAPRILGTRLAPAQPADVAPASRELRSQETHHQDLHQ